MTSVAAIRTDDTLRRFLIASAVLHGALVLVVVVSSFLVRRGENWGGPGGSIRVGVVGSVPAIPLPRPEVETPSRVVDESKGLYKSEPKPKPEPEATPIPKFERNKPPKYVTRPSKILENPTPPPPNAVPYGGGGTPSIPTTTFAMNANAASQGGLSFGGPGSGDFGSRFSWYVEAVQRRISSNWLQSTVDPSVAYAPRAIVTFTILRNGSVTNLQITRSSNNYSVDNSALRAVRDSSPLDRLPPAYAGSEVNVEFWFDFHR
jgi:TonB family protein